MHAITEKAHEKVRLRLRQGLPFGIPFLLEGICFFCFCFTNELNRLEIQRIFDFCPSAPGFPSLL